MSSGLGADCRHRGCVGATVDRPLTLPTMVTLVRTAASVACTVAGLRTGSSTWLLAAQGTYWVGDVVDGALARRLNAETRTGAVLDIICDRCCVAFILLPYASWHSELAIPLGLYLAEFMVIDTFLSLAFLRWPILSPNYFYAVDRPLHRLNWTPAAKAANSCGVAVTAIVLNAPDIAMLVAVTLLAVKVWSLTRLVHLPVWTSSAARGCLHAGRLAHPIG
jgi:CDP-diacylglycerol---glycerol-3-phosphate 3-phosphatidyltransferase